MTTTRNDKDTAIFEQQPPLRALADDERAELVEAGEQGVLATIGRSGLPHQSPVLYRWDPATATARITTRAGRRQGPQHRRRWAGQPVRRGS